MIIEEGHIYKFGNKYFLVVGIENNWQSYYQIPFVFQEAVLMLKAEEITIFRYVVIYIKNLKNIKKSILACDFDVLPYNVLTRSKFIKTVNLNRYNTELVKLRLLNKLPCTMSEKEAKEQMLQMERNHIKESLEKLSSFCIGDFFVGFDEEILYLGMTKSFYILIQLPLTNGIKYITVESFLQYYHKNGKHKEFDTTAFALPEEIIRWSGIKL